MDELLLYKYADLVIRSGINMQAGETLVVRADINAAPLVRAVAKRAYECGAAKVVVKYGDGELSVLDYTYQSVETLSRIESYIVAEKDEWTDKRFPFVAIVSDDPDALADCDSHKVSARIRAMAAATARWRSAELANEFRWTIVAYPSQKWAAKVFPELSVDAAMKKLEKCIVRAVRLDADDAVAAWARHSERLRLLCDRLNGEDIDTLHYKSSNGTDFVVGMLRNYVFVGGSERAQDGRYFNANMPGEEVFSAPDRKRADGVLYSTLPLSRQGKIIDKFWLKFESGRVTDFGAESGCDVLRNIIETDEGSHYLGEIALVQYDSLLQNMGVLFYETLFDENASCHFALGGAYASSIADGENMTSEQRLAAGLNDSNEHVDFMVGARDLTVIATRRDGTQFSVFENGNFAL